MARSRGRAWRATVRRRRSRVRWSRARGAGQVFAHHRESAGAAQGEEGVHGGEPVVDGGRAQVGGEQGKPGRGNGRSEGWGFPS